MILFFNCKLGALFVFFLFCCLDWGNCEKSPREQEDDNNYRVECLSVYEDLQKNDWLDYYNGNLSYAETTDQLPAPLRGKLRGDGIFYFEGGENWIQSLSRNKNGRQSLAETRPIWIYIKYYGHLDKDQEHKNKDNKGKKREMWTYPVMKPSGDSKTSRILPETKGYKWGEELLEINPEKVDEFNVGVEEWNFSQKEYFLVDKIAIVQGHQNPRLCDVREMC